MLLLQQHQKESFKYTGFLHLTMQTEILEEIGLSQSEAKAYVTSLKIGSATNGKIAKKANLNRSNCNEALNRLVNKGLVSYVIKANRKYYEATDPAHILELLNEKKKQVVKVIPELRELKKIKRKEQEANIYEGYKGIKTVFEDILNTLKPGDEYLVFGVVNIPKPFENYIVHWTKRRLKKKLKLKIIFNKDVKKMIEKYKKEKLTDVRVLPKEYVTPAVVNIYGNKTATIVWTKEPLAFVVKNKDYADSFRQYFKLLWKV